MRLGIIGPIGSGKSTLAHLLSTYYNVPLVKEPVESSPFLPLFYSDMKKFGLVSQFSFYGELFLSMYDNEDEERLVCDSTMFSNLVFAELLKKDNLLSQKDVDLIYNVADAHMELLSDLDIHIVLVRDEESLFDNVRKRSRELEKNQYEYLKFHYAHYSEILESVFKRYDVPKQNILYLKVDDMFDELHFNELVKQIEGRYNQILNKQLSLDI